MSTQELQQQLLALTVPEKTQIMQALAQNLGSLWSGISKTPGIVSGDACITGTRIPVWDLVEYRRLGANDLKILEAYPHLTTTNLQNAWAYAAAFPTEISAATAANRKT
jgi:uncharacterized protein (DUF433 family)